MRLQHALAVALVLVLGPLAALVGAGYLAYDQFQGDD